MVLNKEFEFVMNVIMDQDPGSILYKAFRDDEGVSNVAEIMSLSADDIRRIKFTSIYTGEPVTKALGKACRGLILFQDIGKVEEGRQIHQERQSLTVQAEFRIYAIPMVGIKEYIITHDSEELKEGDIDDLSEVIDNEVEICPHCGWRGFQLSPL